MLDTRATAQSSTETDDTTGSDYSRREVLAATGVGVGPGLLQLGWWGSGGSDGGSTDSGTTDGWWGGDDGSGSSGGGGSPDSERPIVFVHGMAGSGSQFASQAMRFASNGYPADYVDVFEYDSLSYGGGLLGSLLGGTGNQQVIDALDATVDDLLAETGEDQVYAVGHSMGTDVLGTYLSDDARAQKVTKYVGIDGNAPDAPPGGVPTLGIWGQFNQDASIPDAENVAIDQSHVQVATSEETFAELYEFLLEEQPTTTRIEPESGPVTVSGRAQLFPSNQAPPSGSTLDVFEVDPATGERRSDEPVASPTVGPDGEWGPISVDPGAYHEYRLTEATNDQVHHHYRFPELRSNHLVRLLTSESGSGIDGLIAKSDDHVALIAIRDKEWWGDQGASSDRLAIDGTNVLNATTAARDSNTIGAFVYDAGTDGQTNLDAQPGLFGALPFMSGVDHYVPAATPPDGTVPLQSEPRGGGNLQREITVPNRASSGHRVSVYFPDDTQPR